MQCRTPPQRCCSAERSSPIQESLSSSDSCSSNNKSNTPRPNRDPMSHRIIEKRRRDRMNNCLSNLSKLIPNSYLKKGRGRVEKTEIIEMAIGYMKSMQAQIASLKSGAIKGMDNNPLSQPDIKPPPPEMKQHEGDYKQGFMDCMAETVKFMTVLDTHEMSDQARNSIVQHLHNYLNNGTVNQVVDQPLNMSINNNVNKVNWGRRPVPSSNSDEDAFGPGPPTKTPRLLRALTMHDSNPDCKFMSRRADQSNIIDMSSCSSSTTHYPSSPSSTQSLSTQPGDSPPPLQGAVGLLQVAPQPTPVVPIFALHPSGLYYVPGTVNAVNLDSHLVQTLASGVPPLHNSACHSVTITVNFCQSPVAMPNSQPFLGASPQLMNLSRDHTIRNGVILNTTSIEKY